MGFVISQERNGAMHPVSFAGRALRDFEKRFTTNEKEVLALIEVIKHNRRFLPKSRINSLHWESNFDLSQELKGWRG